MSEPIYAVGDLQGCLESFEELLDMLDPNASFVFVGDIVNRGPASLETLRRVKALDETGRCRAVLLGNHDLHLLAAAAHQPHGGHRPVQDAGFDAGVAHVGQRRGDGAYAQEVSDALKSKDWKAYLQGMYGDDTDMDKKGAGRMRAILNAFTRMRYVRTDGSLEFKAKMNPKDTPDLMPWFDYPRRFNKTVCFGHWSTLGLVMREDTIAIDTGCLWGGQLTCVRLPDRRLWQVRCPQWASPC